MKRALYAGAALAALGAGSATGQKLTFPIGEGVYSWDTYEALAAENDFTGESLTISGAGTGPDARRQGPPHLHANPEAYDHDTQRALGKILTRATTFRFDGSDLMPGEIGTSAFWMGMVDYTTGESAEDVAAAIQTRWNAIQ